MFKHTARRLFGIMLLLGLGQIWACKPDCANPRSNFILFRFARSTDFRNDTIRLRNINGVGIGLNFLREETSITQFGLPISTQDNEIAYAFESTINNQIVRDTIFFQYQRRLFFIKPNCGLDQEISDLSIIRSTFDTAWVAKSTLENKKEAADVILVLR
jgi:hypothetical protein